jgi:hypothetical protein
LKPDKRAADSLAAALRLTTRAPRIPSFFQLMLATRTIFNDLPAMLVLHLLPAFAFVACAHAADTETGLAIEFADIDTG